MLFQGMTIMEEIYYQVKIRQTTESCLLEEAFSNSCWEQTQLQPPNKLAIICDSPNSTAAPNPNMNASWLGCLHSNIHTFKCLTCFVQNKTSTIGVLHRHLAINYFKTKKITYIVSKMLDWSIHTLFCAISASKPRIPAATSMITIRRQTKMPPTLAILYRTQIFLGFSFCSSWFNLLTEF